MLLGRIPSLLKHAMIHIDWNLWRKCFSNIFIFILDWIEINKFESVVYASVLLLMINCIITLSKWLWNHEPRASGSTVNFDNVMTKFIINKRTDEWKTDVNLSFTITRPQNGQMLGINEGKWHHKHAVNKDKWISFKMTRTLSIAFLAFSLVS